MVRKVNYKNVIGDFVSCKVFGVVGNGVADDTTALQAYANYCMTNGVTMRLPKGTYKITSPILITADLIIEVATGTILNGSAIGNAASQNLVGYFIVEPSTAVGNTRALTADLLKNEGLVTVSSTDRNSFSVGQWVVIRSNNQRYNDTVTSNNKRRGFVAKIVELVGTTQIRLDRVAFQDITVAGASRIQSLPMINNFRIYGDCTIIMGGDTSRHDGILARRVLQFRSDGVSVNTCGDKGFSFASYVLDYLVENGKLENCVNSLEDTGYGLTAGGGCSGIARNVTFSNCRHAIAHGATSSLCQPLNNTAKDCVAYYTGRETLAFDVHEDAIKSKFINCFAHASHELQTGLIGYGGFLIRSNDVLMQGCEAIGASFGVRVSQFETDPGTQQHIDIMNNRFENCGESIRIAPNDTLVGRPSDIQIIGNQLINSVYQSMTINNADNVKVLGNNFDGVTDTSANNGNGIYFFGTSNDIDVSHNSFKNINLSKGLLAGDSAAVANDMKFVYNTNMTSAPIIRSGDSAKFPSIVTTGS
jgi:hypothetical protein